MLLQNIRTKLFFNFCYFLTWHITISLIMVREIKTAKRVLLIGYTESTSFFPLSQDILFLYSDSIFATHSNSTLTDIHQFDIQRQAAELQKLHQYWHFYAPGKIPALCFYMVDGNPVPSSLPNLAFSTYFQRHQPSYTASLFVHSFRYTTLRAMSMYRRAFGSCSPS